ncbi:MAG: septum formation protein Maf [Tidjanibacter sp.]|nr:septum formation protein Maf [Tidjanibacter sp.]MBQ5931067.1 septum formation protein Maf [Tidjanibacter sp.]
MLLKDKLIGRRLLLASKSPRRSQLLRDCGLDFEVVDGREAEEIYPADMPSEQVAEYLSRVKSDAYADMVEGGDVLITADTIVVAGGEILGKPSDREDAVRMLGLLSGASHTVITGVTLRTTDKVESFSCISRVKFRTIEPDEVDYYLDTYRPYDKAGAYGIQEWIGYVAIEGIEGSFYNVMGLPVQMLYVRLKEFV